MLNPFDEIDTIYANVKIPCPFCSGLNEKCPECEGKGKVTESRRISFQDLIKHLKLNWNR